MSYTGHVYPGGPVAALELHHVVLTKMSVGPLDNNVYVFRDRQTGQQLLIDAAAEPERILGEVDLAALVGVITTHAHPDHFAALGSVIDATEVDTMASSADAVKIHPRPTRIVAHGEYINFGASRVEVIELRGHTEAGVALLYSEGEEPPIVITGDSLFPGGVGKTSGGKDFDQLIDDVEARLFRRLPDETRVLPGHGDDTTLGAERPQLASWRRRRW